MAKVRDRKRLGNMPTSGVVASEHEEATKKTTEQAAAVLCAAILERGKPAWDEWLPSSLVELWEAVALSCDIAPSEIAPSEIQAGKTFSRLGIEFAWLESDLNRMKVAAEHKLRANAIDLLQSDAVKNAVLPSLLTIPTKFYKRLRIAQRHLGMGIRVVKTPDDDKTPKHRQTINLTEFAAWAEGLRNPWALPAEFPRPKVEEQKPTVADKPLLTRERDTLLKIILGLAAAHGIPLGDPWIAAQRIEGFTKKAGRRVAARTIEEHLNKAAILPEDKD